MIESLVIDSFLSFIYLVWKYRYWPMYITARAKELYEFNA
jgi:hypothetical protein